MGFTFSAFFFFVLITRTAHLDYNSGFLVFAISYFPAAVQQDSCLTHSLASLLLLPAVNLSVSVVIGVLGGVTLVTSWWRFGSVMACVVVVGLVLGFMVASTVLFTPLGRWEETRRPVRPRLNTHTHAHALTHNVPFLCVSRDPPSGDLSVLRHSDLLFWVTFCSIMVTVPLFFVRWPREVPSPTASEPQNLRTSEPDAHWSLFILKLSNKKNCSTTKKILS